MSLKVYDDEIAEGLEEFTISLHPEDKLLLSPHALFYINDNDCESSNGIVMYSTTSGHTFFNVLEQQSLNMFDVWIETCSLIIIVLLICILIFSLQ